MIAMIIERQKREPFISYKIGKKKIKLEFRYFCQQFPLPKVFSESWPNSIVAEYLGRFTD